MCVQQLELSLLLPRGRCCLPTCDAYSNPISAAIETRSAPNTFSQMAGAEESGSASLCRSRKTHAGRSGTTSLHSPNLLLRQYYAWLLRPIPRAAHYDMLTGTGQLLVRELYQVLGVRSDAAEEDIKSTFRRLAKQLHPDLHPGDADAERRLQQVIRAYETLSDRPSRIAYDAGLANQRLLRRWRFRANAMTVVAAFALTVSVGLHWRVLSEAILSPGDHEALTGNERGDAAPKKSPEVNVDSLRVPGPFICQGACGRIISPTHESYRGALIAISRIGRSGEQRPQPSEPSFERAGRGVRYGDASGGLADFWNSKRTFGKAKA